MKKFFIILTILMANLSVFSQLYQPEGLNMPGEWCNWSNPPEKLVFASDSQVIGGTVHRISDLSTAHYQTIFSTPADTLAGTYEFLFTSGPTSNYWANKWTDVTVSINSFQTYTFHNDGGGSNNSITLADNKFYVMNWEDNGYTDTRAIFMELSANPVSITNVSQDTNIIQETESQTITISTDNTPPTEQHFFVRYTTNDWTTSSTIEASFSGNTGNATISGVTGNKTVEYYVFSTTLTNFSSFSGNDYDLITINFDNNNGSNYSYNVVGELSCDGEIGVLTTDPVFPLQDGSVIITFDATLGNAALAGYEGDVYAHTGVITSASTDDNDWRYVKTDWGENTADTKFTNVGTDIYQLTISNIRDYYAVPDSEDIYAIAMVIRSDEPISPDDPNNFYVARNADGSDFHLPVYDYGLNSKILSPSKKDPLVPMNTIIPVCAYAMGQTDFSLLIDGTQVTTTTSDTIVYGLNTANYTPGMHYIIADATDGSAHHYDTTNFYIRGDVVVEDLPNGVENGINYIDDNTVTLVLEDPPAAKNFVFVIGDFSDWKVSDEGYMKRTPDGTHFWVTLDNLTAGQEYAFQYYIDGEIKIADPYADKILDPWNDRYITDYNYPNLKQYPYDETKGIVSVFQTAQTPYDWQIENFTPPAVGETQPNLVVYELLIRDFVSTSAIKDVEAKLDYLQGLGVNAIELMPINEFEGNLSWGYNPDFYFAPDKYYGTKNDYKHFIDACHQRGIAVIMDMVLNHSFGLSPLLQMYWDSDNNIPATNNPWYNQYAPHPLSPGYDFNHESQYTKELVKRILSYWMTEYKIDGFRFDLSKGFTQTYTGSDISAWSHYDQSRIDIWNDYYSYIKSVNPNAYVILEHLADNDEETVLANAGMLLWGQMNEQFSQVSMGYTDNSDFSWAYYANRGYTYPNLIPFMESHDEERLMYNNLTYGNSSGSYDIKDLNTALGRIEALAPFYIAIPGPKMIWQFGELGYDYSINYCEDGTISEDCRTSPKPIHWDYYQNDNRQDVFAVYQNMIHLKTSQDAFRTGTFSYDISGTGKREWISSSDLNVLIAGNFDVTGFDMALGFQHTGTWYDLFNQTTVDVTDVNMTEYFDPGEFHVYTDVYFPLEDLPDITSYNNIEDSELTIFPNPADNYFTVRANDLYKISVYDLTGKCVLETEMQNMQQTIDISSLIPGIYSIVFRNNTNVIVKKIIIK